MYGLNPGDRIGPYVLDGPIGAGGQGSVWRARADGAPTPVALKLIPVRGSPVTMVERVRREAESLVRLSGGQPSVVSCLGLVEDAQNGLFGVAMTLVEGQELGATLRDPRCDAGMRETLLGHVARALAYLHQQGMVHRDVKPQNILVSRSFFGAPHDPENVKLVDFGIATMLGNPKPLTEVGTVVGTPAYMPPERIDPLFWEVAQGRPTEDVFAFGVVAYEAFFGRHPANVSDDGTLSIYAERYRQISRTGEAWPQLPPGHRWTAALRGALTLKRSERLVDGAAVVAAFSPGGQTMDDPGLGGRAPVPKTAAADIHDRPGSTEAAPVHNAPIPGATALPPYAAAPMPPQYGAPATPAPAYTAPPAMGGLAMPPPRGGIAMPPPRRQPQSNTALKALIAVTAIGAVAIPAMLIARSARSNDDSTPPPPVIGAPATVPSAEPAPPSPPPTATEISQPPPVFTPPPPVATKPPTTGGGTTVVGPKTPPAATTTTPAPTTTTPTTGVPRIGKWPQTPPTTPTPTTTPHPATPQPTTGGGRPPRIGR
ncbi:MAG: serine/threonine protein kinase [Polyangiaceae bacterium]|nr:serine/threonine protein kinase [Polyangiaceae bacterium]